MEQTLKTKYKYVGVHTTYSQQYLVPQPVIAIPLIRTNAASSYALMSHYTT